MRRVRALLLCLLSLLFSAPAQAQERHLPLPLGSGPHGSLLLPSARVDDPGGTVTATFLFGHEGDSASLQLLALHLDGALSARRAALGLSLQGGLYPDGAGGAPGFGPLGIWAEVAPRPSDALRVALHFQVDASLDRRWYADTETLTGLLGYEGRFGGVAALASVQVADDRQYRGGIAGARACGLVIRPMGLRLCIEGLARAGQHPAAGFRLEAIGALSVTTLDGYGLGQQVAGAAGYGPGLPQWIGAASIRYSRGASYQPVPPAPPERSLDWSSWLSVWRREHPGVSSDPIASAGGAAFCQVSPISVFRPCTVAGGVWSLGLNYQITPPPVEVPPRPQVRVGTWRRMTETEEEAESLPSAFRRPPRLPRSFVRPGQEAPPENPPLPFNYGYRPGEPRRDSIGPPRGEGEWPAPTPPEPPRQQVRQEPPSQQPPSARTPYEHLPEPRMTGPGLPTTRAQRARILDANRARNSGAVRSDQSGIELVPPRASRRGTVHAPNEAHVDHIDPRSNGGSNGNVNLQVLGREENLRKGNR